MQVKVDTLVGLARFPRLPHTNTLWQRARTNVATVVCLTCNAHLHGHFLPTLFTELGDCAQGWGAPVH